MSGKLVGCGRVSTRRKENESRRSDNAFATGRILGLPRPRRKLLLGLKERPYAELQHLCPDGSVLKTSQAVCWGWFQVRMRRFFLMKSPAGAFFAQVESPLTDEAKLLPLNTRAEVVAVWNRCSVKLPADRLFA